MRVSKQKAATSHKEISKEICKKTNNIVTSKKARRFNQQEEDYKDREEKLTIGNQGKQKHMTKIIEVTKMRR